MRKDVKFVVAIDEFQKKQMRLCSKSHLKQLKLRHLIDTIEENSILIRVPEKWLQIFGLILMLVILEKRLMSYR